jgi:hypothetical protein
MALARQRSKPSFGAKASVSPFFDFGSRQQHVTPVKQSRWLIQSSMLREAAAAAPKHLFHPVHSPRV